MVIAFRTNKLKRQCEDPKVAQKDFGAAMSRLLTRRIAELQAASSLEDIRRILPARLHRLSGRRSNEFAVDLVQPFRLVFSAPESTEEDLAKLHRILSVRIEEVVDYHGK